MKEQAVTFKIKEWFNKHSKISNGVKIAICILPAFSIILYYLLRPVQGAMEWVVIYISRPVRTFLSMFFSIYPLAVTEILITAAGIFLIYYIIKAIRDCWRRRERWKILGKRILWLLVTACYLYGAFCWLWSSGYHAKGFAERSGLVPDGVKKEDLIAVTEHFARKANELSQQLERDENGSLVINRREVLRDSQYIYSNISNEFKSLKGNVYAAKPMYLYSSLMSVSGYTGVYLALTGESMINIHEHAAYIPVTAAHEIAHQCGVFAEDEATLAGILACVTSNNPVFEYSGYMSGLYYLSGALAGADTEEYIRIMSTLTDEVNQDNGERFTYWANVRKSELGIELLDRFLSNIKHKTNEVVDAVYDNFLKSEKQELGRQTYGACVDLLVEYYRPSIS